METVIQQSTVWKLLINKAQYGYESHRQNTGRSACCGVVFILQTFGVALGSKYFILCTKTNTDYWISLQYASYVPIYIIFQHRSTPTFLDCSVLIFQT